jgi:hypothetical protein
MHEAIPKHLAHTNDMLTDEELRAELGWEKPTKEELDAALAIIQ